MPKEEAMQEMQVLEVMQAMQAFLTKRFVLVPVPLKAYPVVVLDELELHFLPLGLDDLVKEVL